MTRIALSAAAVALVLAASPVHALIGGSAAELEHARANARAGGPVSERDRELLERWGCLSGTRNPVCDPRYRADERPPTRRKSKRRR